MTYQVIARKYRPQRFGDVVGQDHVTTTLSHAIEQGRIAHAYLFCGPRGTGKTTVARIFAKCLNSTGGPRLDFPDDDPRCVEIAEGRSLDVIEIDGASNRGIDEIRSLRDTVKYAPATSKFKVYIIDEVHMLTKEAFNALLKTLEEPPAHVKFMFATTEPEKVLPTILSRCQRFDLRRIPAALIVRHLAQIAVQEGVTLNSEALHAIARGADGGMRDAESTLDQLISFCGNRIEEADVLSMFGLASQGQVVGLFQAMVSGDIAGALRHLDELCRHGKDLGRLLADLLQHARNLLLVLVAGDDSPLSEVSEAELQTLRQEAGQISLPELTRMLEVLSEHERKIRDAGSRRIMFEVALLKTIEARKALSIDDLLEQLQSLRTGQPSAAAAARGGSGAAKRHRSEPQAPSPAPPAELPAAPPPPPATVRPAGAPGSLAEIWESLMSSLATSHRFVQTYLAQAHPVALDRGVLTIGYDPSVAEQLDLVNTDRNRQVIQSRLGELGVEIAQVRFVSAPGPGRAAEIPPEPVPAPAPQASPPKLAPAPAPTSPEPVPFDKASFKQDPLIQKALEIFRGEIVDIRTP